MTENTASVAAQPPSVTTAVLASRTEIELLIAAARHRAAGWRIEGSRDWQEKPGRLTVWMDVDRDTWDEVYDRIGLTTGELGSPPEVNP